MANCHQVTCRVNTSIGVLQRLDVVVRLQVLSVVCICLLPMDVWAIYFETRVLTELAVELTWVPLIGFTTFGMVKVRLELSNMSLIIFLDPF